MFCACLQFKTVEVEMSESKNISHIQRKLGKINLLSFLNEFRIILTYFLMLLLEIKLEKSKNYILLIKSQGKAYVEFDKKIWKHP